MHQLIIHHDIGIINKDGKLEKEPSGLGHVYLELLNNEESVVCGIVSGFGVSDSSYSEYRPHGEERLDLARKYEVQHPADKILHSKTINITEIQYLEAMVLLDDYEQYIGKKMPSEIYGLFSNNCAHFVNHIYRSMGLEGDYTRNYRTSELHSINSVLSKGYKVLGLYPGDKSFTVFGSSIEEVAKKYNVDESLVSHKEAIQGIPDADFVIEQQAANQFTFVIAPNPLLVASEAHDDAKAAVGSPSTDETEDSNKMIDAFKQGQELAQTLLQEVPNHLQNFQQQHGDWLASIAPGPNLAGFEQGRILAQNLSRQGFPHTPELAQALGLGNTASHAFNPFQSFGVQTMGATNSETDDEFTEDID